MPNVIISPHVAGQGSSGYPQQRKLFGENLARFRAGKPMLNECKVHGCKALAHVKDAQ